MKTAAAFFMMLVLLAATPALARSSHRQHANPPARASVDSGSRINSGYYPPRNWNEIEVSTPSGGF